MDLTLQQPWALVLLLAVPVYIVAAWRLGALEHRLGRTATAIRAVGVTLLVLSIAQLALLRHHDELAVIFVVDGSRSIGAPGQSATGGSQKAQTFVADALKARPEKDMAGVVVFGQNPEIETMVRPDPSQPLWAARPESGGTDIEAALRLALASFPPDTHRRLVVLSDGIETHGQAAQQAVIARELGVPIDVVPLETINNGPDIIAEALIAPPTVEVDRPFDLRFQIRSPQQTNGKLRLYRGDELLGETEVSLRQGLDVLTLPQTLSEPGLHRFRAVIDAQPDGESRNNEVRTTVQVGGQPTVLVLEGYGDASAALVASLQQNGLSVTSGDASDMPDTLEGMAQYDVIMLSDIPGTEMSRLQMRALEQYVTDLGKGLIMLGGDQSFGLGGYYKTPVERTLPVKMTRKAQVQIPSQGIAMAIDRSGSMAGMRGVSKMELAKEAAVAVVELMNADKDELGVVGFDSFASWVVPYNALRDKDEVIRRIGTLRAGGGTDIYAGLKAAYRGISGGNARIKHIILLSDGVSNPADLPGLAKELRADGITLTTVSIGADSDRFTMETLAKLGGGRYYETESADAIPQIFTRETMLSSRNFLVEESFAPMLGDNSDVLKGIDALPLLDGYVATSAKSRATVALLTPKGEPLMAHWRKGLGKSMAFTSDAKGRWAGAWLADPTLYTRFWVQAVRWTSQTGANNTLALATSMRGGTLTLTVDALDDERWRDGATTVATVVSPDGQRREVPLRQVAPGRYRAEVDASAEGTYYVSAVQSADGEELGRAVRELHRAYSPEFAPAHTGAPVLQELAGVTGGVYGAKPQEIWKRPDTPLTTPRPLTPYLLAALALLWLLDVAHRRFEGWRPPGKPTPAPDATAAGLPAPVRAAVPGPRPPSTPQTPSPVSKPEAIAAPQASEAPKERAFTSRLLDAKRRGRKKK